MPMVYLRNDLYKDIIRTFPDEEIGEVVNRFVDEKLKEVEE